MRFCVVGTGRCGSTLAQRMLNAHPEMFVYPETHWIPKMYEWFGGAAGPTDCFVDIIQRTRHANGEPTTPIDEGRLRASCGGRAELTVREFCDGLGQMLAAEAGKRHWADKTPDYAYFMSSLQSIWPDCRFIHVVRNGADVVASMSRHVGYRALAASGELFWCPVSFDFEPQPAERSDLPLERFVRLWHLRLARLRDEATRLARGTFVNIRYEDLVRDPAGTLCAISAFVDLEAPQPWIDAASALVRPARTNAARTAEVLRHFDASDLRLLEATGYDVGKSLPTARQAGR